MSRPRRTSLDPEWFNAGEIGRQTAMGLGDLVPDLDEPVLAIVLDRLVARLPEPERSAVEMCAMAGMAYGEAVEHFDTDWKKTVWRWEKRGLEQLEEWLTTPWMRELLSHKVPVEELEQTESIRQLKMAV